MNAINQLKASSRSFLTPTIFFTTWSRTPELDCQHLPSRHPLSRQCSKFKWLQFQHLGNTAPASHFSVLPNTVPAPGGDLTREARVTLNPLQTEIGRFNHKKHRWGLCPTAARICGPADQTAHRVIKCPTLRPPEDITLDLTQ